MSDTSQGPGWWQASDLRWYPPELHEDPAHVAAWPSSTLSARRRSPARGRTLAGAVAVVVLLAAAAWFGADALVRDAASATPAWVPIQIDHPVPARVALRPVLTASGATRGVVITPARAQSVFRALWRLRQEAFTTHDRSFLAAFETGPALEADETTCGCLHRDPRGPIVTDSVLIPRASRLPATFLGEATTTLDGSPYQRWLVIERTSTATPWMVVSDPGDTNVWGLDEGSSSPGGFDVERPPGASSHSLPSLLAAYYQSWTDRGHAPAATRFRAGPWTTATGAQLVQNPQGATSSRTGLEYHYRYQSGSPHDLWSFGTTTGGLVCSVAYEQDTSTSPTGGVLQDASQVNFGPTVAPGVYERIVTTYVAQPCFLEQPGGGVQVVSGIMDDDTEQAFDPLSVP